MHRSQERGEEAGGELLFITSAAPLTGTVRVSFFSSLLSTEVAATALNCSSGN